MAEMPNGSGWSSLFHAITNHDWRGPSSTAAACCAFLASLGAFVVHLSGWSVMANRWVFVWMAVGLAGLCFLVVPRFHRHFQRKEDRLAEIASGLRNRADHAEELLNRLHGTEEASSVQASIMEFAIGLSIFRGRLTDLGLSTPDPSLLMGENREAQSFELLRWASYLRTVADAAEERTYSAELRQVCKRNAEMPNPDVAAPESG